SEVPERAREAHPRERRGLRAVQVDADARGRSGRAAVVRGEVGARDVLDRAAAAGRAGPGDGKATARARRVQPDAVRPAVGGAVLEGQAARSDVRARDVESRPGGGV